MQAWYNVLVLQIVQAPNAVLAEKAKPITKIDGDILSLIEEMKQTLENAVDPQGVGLAAPQVDKSYQLFIMKPTEKGRITVVMNPTVVSIDPTPEEIQKKDRNKLEGCLSLARIWGTVRRSPKITISFMDYKGRKLQKTFSGFSAVVVQHEMDHLEGVLFPRRVLEQKGTLYKQKRNKEGEDIFEEIEV